MGENTSVIVVLLAGSFGASLITFISSIVMWYLNKKSDLKKNESKSIDGLRKANMIILRDLLKSRGQEYILAGSVSLNDREDILQMYDIYHDDLGGNGNVTALMNKVKELPLKIDG